MKGYRSLTVKSQLLLLRNVVVDGACWLSLDARLEQRVETEGVVVWKLNGTRDDRAFVKSLGVS